MNPSGQVSSLQVDVDKPNFYNNVEGVINNDKANLKKSITIKRNLRIEAAEMEVETAALYLNMHWSELDKFRQLDEQKAEFVRMLNALLASLNKHLTDMNFVPTGMAVSYVKITVNALSPPKVDYDNLYHRVSIKYSWVQIAQSTYNIIVKGIPNA
ncbi:hypothetical protein RR48_12029 [Papilio machaon]|uniref:Uncharacterized protein n=1 Tax=Papilio machaon TaxID=76193 RepID=A0A194RQ81_PAPMA|nr:hypothetical protein RR48_12029 [Papilio machaon]